MLFWWNPHCRIEVNPKSNLIFSMSFSFFSFFVKLLSWFLNDGGSFYFSYLGYGHEKHKNYKNLVFICSSIMVWFLGFSLRKEARWKKNNNKKIKIKAYEGLKPWSLLFGLNGFTHELIGPKQIIFYSQINNIVLITLVCKMSQEVLEFPFIGLKIFWPWLVV